MAEILQKKPELSSRLQRTTQELKSTQNFGKDRNDRCEVLMEFRTAAERARQAGAAV